MLKSEKIIYLIKPLLCNKTSYLIASTAALAFTQPSFGWDSKNLRRKSPNQDLESIFIQDYSKVKEKIKLIKKEGKNNLAIVTGICKYPRNLCIYIFIK